MPVAARMTLPPHVHPRVEPARDAGGLDDAAARSLTARMVAGEVDAYEQLFRSRCALVESEAARRLGRRHDLSDDVAQEAWLRVARAPRACPGLAALDGWLRRIVRSVAIDVLRSELSRACRERRTAMTRTEAVAFLEDLDALEDIRREASDVAGLSAEERAIFELQVRTGATVARLAGMLGIGPAALDSRLRRAAGRARALRNAP